MLYSVHLINLTRFDQAWLTALRNNMCLYAYSRDDFATLEQAQEYAQQVIEHTGCEVIIIEDYDIDLDWGDPNYSPVVHQVQRKII